MAETVQYGIDLGTTNSAIARMTAKGAEILPVRRANYIPSVVAVDRRGDLKVGAEAVNPQLQYARLFKRLMGTRNTTRLADGSEWLPERLSAEVLKALAAAARLKTGEDVREVVITVPAMFNQPQCAATQEAARLAGLEAVALLQEPIAAATAYLSENPTEGDYLVYDLGGGTFDVSLVRLRDGEMNVLEHGGDNYLGGSDFDRLVFDWTLDQIDRKGGDVALFESGAPRLSLFGAVEEARLALSDTELATIYLDEFDLPIAKLELTRERLEDLVSDLVTRSIAMAKDRLRVGGSVRAALLVGGPTQMPYIRRRLAAELGVPLGIDQDPMTVVAEGAAIHAGSLQRRSPVPSSAPSTEASASPTARLELHYDPVTSESVGIVAGMITEPKGMPGEIRIVSTLGDWETGWIALRNGAFSTEVSLGRHASVEYRLDLRDAEGRAVACAPASFSIRSGVRAAQAVTPYDYAVVLEGGTDRGVVVRAGAPLPASGHAEFRLAQAIRAGTADVASVYFVEGNSAFADENTKVGELKIAGDAIERSIREGERVEVRIRMDESRRLTASVYVPVLDQEFKVEFATSLETPHYDDLALSLREAKTTLSELEDHASSEDEDVILRAGRRIEGLEATLDRAERGEPGEAERIQKGLADAKAELRPLKEKYGLTAIHARTIVWIEDAENLARAFEERMTLAKLADLREEADRTFRLGQERGLNEVETKAKAIFWPLYTQTTECWEEQLDLLDGHALNVPDRLTFDEHRHAARIALVQLDLEACRLHVLRAWDLVPRRERAVSRFGDAALRS